MKANNILQIATNLDFFKSFDQLQNLYTNKKTKQIYSHLYFKYEVLKVYVYEHF